MPPRIGRSGMVEWRGCELIWGCDPSRQLEVSWLQLLLQPASQTQWPCQGEDQALPAPTQGLPVVLVESGLLHLERSPDPQRLQIQRQQRQQRLEALGRWGPFAVVHLSDEEGFDGDDWYPLLPDQTVIWRNFPYPRFQQRVGLYGFPIGPRAEFLSVAYEQAAAAPASGRAHPWAFMGTLWASGSRTLAASLFLRALPHGIFFGGRRFGQGLPLEEYRQHLLTSCFALCPEGDRHLDTFRLYESLQAGCIPLLVDQRSMASALLGGETPVPVFTSWLEALAWVETLLGQPMLLDHTQQQVRQWWQRYRTSLAGTMRHTLLEINS